jgi:UDPglucose--hexose-1-phosphate uridylyltransferase
MAEMPRSPHRRYNPLLDEWVLCSPHRLERPWQGQVEDEVPETRARFDPSCYLCPGNARANGQVNPSYASTYVFDNDFPALLGESRVPPLDESGLLVVEPATGRCRVVCFSPRHDLTLAEMTGAEIRPVVDAWAAEVATLGADPKVLLGEYLEKELALGERVVCRNGHWVALVPFWAVWPYEVMLLPVRRVPDLPGLDEPERAALADLLRRISVRYDNLFRTSFPYSMGFHGRPTDGADHPHWRLHAVFFPPLLRSATVRKFLVGYEMTAEPQRDLTAEEAARRLREQPETHYRRTCP